VGHRTAATRLAITRKQGSCPALRVDSHTLGIGEGRASRACLAEQPPRRASPRLLSSKALPAPTGGGIVFRPVVATPTRARLKAYRGPAPLQTSMSPGGHVTQPSAFGSHLACFQPRFPGRRLHDRCRGLGPSLWRAASAEPCRERVQRLVTRSAGIGSGVGRIAQMQHLVAALLVITGPFRQASPVRVPRAGEVAPVGHHQV
jgi:hypothetical protein